MINFCFLPGIFVPLDSRSAARCARAPQLAQSWYYCFGIFCWKYWRYKFYQILNSKFSLKIASTTTDFGWLLLCVMIPLSSCLWTPKLRLFGLGRWDLSHFYYFFKGQIWVSTQSSQCILAIFYFNSKSFYFNSKFCLIQFATKFCTWFMSSGVELFFCFIYFLIRMVLNWWWPAILVS